MIKIKGLSIKEEILNNFLIDCDRKNIKIDCLSNEEFKSLVEEFKENC